MNYLLSCETDDSYSIVDKKKMIHDDTEVFKKGDKVSFFYNKKQFEGKIEKISEDIEYLNSELERLKKARKNRPKARKNPSDKELRKRQHIAEKVWTPDMKQPTKNSQKQKTEPKKSQQKLISSTNNMSQERVRRFVTEEKRGQLKDMNRVEKTVSQKREQNGCENEENIKLRKTKKERTSVANYCDHEEDDKQKVSDHDENEEVSDHEEDKGVSDDEKDKEVFDHEEDKEVSDHEEDKEVFDHEKGASDHDEDKEVSDDEKETSDNNKDSEAVDDHEEQAPHYDENPPAVNDHQKEAANHDKDRQASNDNMMDDELRELMDPAQQLIGLTSQEKMEESKYGVRCLKNVYDSAVGSSTEGTHLARRLIIGVFTMRHILRSTYTGAPPHAQGAERLHEKVMCLNNDGKNAIQDFVIDYCKKKWPVPERKDLKGAMSQRLGEIKRQHRMNRLRR